MEPCSRVTRCPLFKCFSVKSALVVWTTRYCQGNPDRCERLKLATAGMPVPPNLLPNGKLLNVPFEVAGPEHVGNI